MESQDWFSLDSRLPKSLFLALSSRQTLVTQYRLAVDQVDTEPIIPGEDCLEAPGVIRTEPSSRTQADAWAREEMRLLGGEKCCLRWQALSRGVFSRSAPSQAS